jgi:hypothetical protein
VNTRYTAQAVGFNLYDADEEKGTAPQVGVELRVIEGPEAGKTIFWYGSLHENAQTYTVDALRAMGWSCNNITELEGLGSLKVIAVEKQEEWKGKVRTKYMIFPVKTPKPTLEADSKASFGARFKALAASVAPIKATELNAGLAEDALPAALPKNGTGAVAASDGPATGGVPF